MRGGSEGDSFCLVVISSSGHVAITHLAQIHWFISLPMMSATNCYIHLQHHISELLILFLSPFLTVQESRPHMLTGNMKGFTSVPFVVVGTSLSLHIIVSPDNAFLPSARHLLISPIHSHMLSILAPRKIKLSTISTSSFLGLKLVMFFRWPLLLVFGPKVQQTDCITLHVPSAVSSQI